MICPRVSRWERCRRHRRYGASRAAQNQLTKRIHVREIRVASASLMMTTRGARASSAAAKSAAAFQRDSERLEVVAAHLSNSCPSEIFPVQRGGRPPIAKSDVSPPFNGSRLTSPTDSTPGNARAAATSRSNDLHDTRANPRAFRATRELQPS